MEKSAPAAGTLPKRPSRNPKPTATLLEHSEGAALPSQQKKIDDYRAAEAARQQSTAGATAASSTTTTPAPSNPSSPSPSSELEYPISPDVGPTYRKRKASVSNYEELEDEIEELDISDVPPGKRK
jgi:hypothetical protein